MKPAKAVANEILTNHGPTGWLVRWLQRYALLGWALFLFVLVMHFLIVFVSTFAPRPVVAVDASGRVLGTMEYLAPSARSNEEIIAASKRFAMLFMSLNSATIYEEYAEAMNMMGEELAAQTQMSLKSTNYLTQVEKAKAHSWLEFAPDGGATILARDGLTARVRLVGNIMVDTGSEPIAKPFDITLETEAVARNFANTSGLKIIARKDN